MNTKYALFAIAGTLLLRVASANSLCTTESLASSTDAKAKRDSADAKTAAALNPQREPSQPEVTLAKGTNQSFDASAFAFLGDEMTCCFMRSPRLAES